MTPVLQPSWQAASVTLISPPSAAGNAGAGSVRGRAARPRWADWAILVRQLASAWALQGMQNRLAEPRRAGNGPGRGPRVDNLVYQPHTRRAPATGLSLGSSGLRDR